MTKVDRVEAELNALIEKEAKRQAKEQEVDDRERRRRELAEDRERAEWLYQQYEFHCAQMERLSTTMVELVDRHRKKRDECARLLGWHTGDVEDEQEVA